ncbi:MAG TPA: DUF4340 domain-containing protein [Candidatus Syntrophosphaera sp.]|nr:DUF4340 domain-containing protein [Candidatus Syntrophosphaera sp.]HOH49004.1 DUF4340 domain-containing protein [Candidatus Syntrophosphaera sp.]HPW39022.1 DUF4340 domain-containing protein [Candidatus Syntrophosphaera sp.]HQC47573.1 DUF4340 domain-containing protein [Candidatus Syntrophosphaera sp.]
MKKNKLVLLAVFLLMLASVVILVLTRRDRESNRAIFSADSTVVAAIEIASPDTSISFALENGRWRITKPVAWDVEEGHFQLFMRDVILKQYSTEPIASGKEALKQYRLTKDNALRIKAFDARNKLLREVWFGDLGNPFDYFCFAGGTNVFQIRSKVNSFYGPKLESWRSPYALSLFPDQLLTINVKHQKNSYELTRNGDIWHYSDKIEDFDIPPGNLVMGKLLNALSHLGSHTMLSGETLPPASSVPAPECEVDLMLNDNSRVKLSFHAWENKNYLLKIDRYPDSYFVVLFDTVFRFTRHAALFRAVVGDPSSIEPQN